MLSSYESVSTINHKFLNYEINYVYSKKTFDRLSIITMYNNIIKYKFKSVDAIMRLKIEIISNNNCFEKHKTILETPNSIYDLLKDKKNSI